MRILGVVRFKPNAEDRLVSLTAHFEGSSFSESRTLSALFWLMHGDCEVSSRIAFENFSNLIEHPIISVSSDIDASIDAFWRRLDLEQKKRALYQLLRPLKEYVSFYSGRRDLVPSASRQLYPLLVNMCRQLRFEDEDLFWVVALKAIYNASYRSDRAARIFIKMGAGDQLLEWFRFIEATTNLPVAQFLQTCLDGVFSRSFSSFGKIKAILAERVGTGFDMLGKLVLSKEEQIYPRGLLHLLIFQLDQTKRFVEEMSNFAMRFRDLNTTVYHALKERIIPSLIYHDIFVDRSWFLGNLNIREGLVIYKKCVAQGASGLIGHLNERYAFEDYLRTFPQRGPDDSWFPAPFSADGALVDDVRAELLQTRMSYNSRVNTLFTIGSAEDILGCYSALAKTKPVRNFFYNMVSLFHEDEAVKKRVKAVFALAESFNERSRVIPYHAYPLSDMTPNELDYEFNRILAMKDSDDSFYTFGAVEGALRSMLQCNFGLFKDAVAPSLWLSLFDKLIGKESLLDLLNEDYPNDKHVLLLNEMNARNHGVTWDMRVYGSCNFDMDLLHDYAAPKLENAIVNYLSSESAASSDQRATFEQCLPTQERAREKAIAFYDDCVSVIEDLDQRREADDVIRNLFLSSLLIESCHLLVTRQYGKLSGVMARMSEQFADHMSMITKRASLIDQGPVNRVLDRFSEMCAQMNALPVKVRVPILSLQIMPSYQAQTPMLSAGAPAGGVPAAAPGASA